jgi:multidrug efflux pump subunit AcrB
MYITDLAIRYRTSVLILTLLLVGGGVASYVTIPKESNPSIEIPTIVVTTVYPGASPDDVERLLTQPIEQEVQTINGIVELRSTSSEGVSTVVIEFDPSVPMDEANQKVRDKVDVARPDLPSDVEEPVVAEIDVSAFPILSINLGADYGLAQLKTIAEDIEDALEALPDVLEVNLIGGVEREVQVNVDLSRLQGYNLSFADLVETIQAENTNLPGGSIDVDRQNYLVRVDGQFRDPAEIEQLVVAAPAGQPIFVRDVAEVVFGFKERSSYARLQQYQVEVEGRPVPVAESEVLPVMTLSVKKRTGANVLKTTDEVRRVLTDFPLPPGTEMAVVGDVSKQVRGLVSDLENNIVSGLIFVVLVLLFFLGARTALLVGVAIPLSMFVSFLVFSMMGVTLNVIILFSLIVALGMLVDNAVVIVENIYRFREQGASPWEAAREGTTEVGGAVVASTATTVAAFAPMLFWPGFIGAFMSYLPLTLIITLTCSLFVALVINPVVTGLFARPPGETRSTAPLSRRARMVACGLIAAAGVVLGLANWETLVAMALIIPVAYFLYTRVLAVVGERFIKSGLPRLVEGYRWFLEWMLERDYTVRFAYLRNMLVLGSLTVGALLALIGGLLADFGSPVVGTLGAAGAAVLLPAFLLLGIGILGIVVHALESAFLGRMKTVKVGAAMALTGAVLAFVLWMTGRAEGAAVLVALLTVPALLLVVGALGVGLAGDRHYLLLTDNRARLLTATLALLLAIFALFRVAPTGVAFFPPTDPNQIIVEAEAPLGTSLAASDAVATELQERIARLVEAVPAAQANLKNVLVGVGVGGDIFFGGGPARPERSRVTLNMVDFEDRAESSAATLRRLREEVEGLPGVTLTFTQDEEGPPTGAPVNIELSGPDFERLTALAQEVRTRLVEAGASGRIPGLVDVTGDVDNGRPELKVVVDRERAAQFGLSTAQVAEVVRAAINGVEASTFRSGDEEIDVTVRLREADRARLEDVSGLTILHEGEQIPISTVAHFELDAGLGAITRLDQQRVVTVRGEAAPGYNGNAVLAQVQDELADYANALPPGYTLTYTGESEDQDASFRFLTRALLLGVSLIFLILVARFNSVSGPLIIMVAVGLSLIGVLLGLILTRTPFSLFTFIGIISLAGIVVNNAIVLVDYTRQLRERGKGKRAAIVEAGATRLRPVLLTALTTVLGLIPLTFGLNVDFVGLLRDLTPNVHVGSPNTQFWGPMGLAIMSGLTFGTFLTLVIVPVLYSAFDSLANWLRTARHAPQPVH